MPLSGNRTYQALARLFEVNKALSDLLRVQSASATVDFSVPPKRGREIVSDTNTNAQSKLSVEVKTTIGPRRCWQESRTS